MPPKLVKSVRPQTNTSDQQSRPQNAAAAIKALIDEDKKLLIEMNKCFQGIHEVVSKLERNRGNNDPSFFKRYEAMIDDELGKLPDLEGKREDVNDKILDTSKEFMDKWQSALDRSAADNVRSGRVITWVALIDAPNTSAGQTSGLQVRWRY